jgi:protocatechuate 3,4-dioxygenase beta subunit
VDGVTPLPDVHVSADDFDTDEWMEDTETDQDGFYSLVLPNGTYRVKADPSCDGTNYVSEWYNDTYDWDEATAVSVTAPDDTSGINFTLDVGGTISGFVYQEDGVTPLPDVHVYADDFDTHEWMEGTDTDQDGFYSLILPNGTYRVRANPSENGLNYVSEWYNGAYNGHEATSVPVTAPDDTSGINFTLELGGTISGYVYQEDGVTPLPDVHVYADDFDTHEWIGGTSTDQYGFYSLILPNGTYRVRANPCENGLDYVSEWYNDTYDGDEATAVSVTAPDDTSCINFTLEVGGTISGYVYQVDGVTPLSNAQVCIECYDSGEGFGCVNSDASGFYQAFGMSSGDYRVDAIAQGYVTEWYDNTLWHHEAQPVSVNAPDNTPNINFTLELEGTISGTVRDSQGNLLADVSVECGRIDGPGGEGTETGSDGTYTITGLPTGKYKVRAFKSGYAREYSDNVFPSHEAAIIEVAAPNETSSINFNLTEGGSISGHIYQSDGVTPISRARVFVRPSKYGFDDGFYATTNSTGYYWVDCLSLGNYRVTAEASGYAMLKYYDGVYGWDSATDVKVTPPHSTPDIDINLDLAGSISGFVYASDGTTSIPNVDLVADTTTGSFEGIGDMSNDDGSYIICGLPPGNYTVRTGEDMPNWYAGEFYDSKYTWGTADKVTVTAGNDTSNINFALDEGGWVTGHVFDEETGNPISGIQLGASMPDGDGVTPAPLTAYDGNYKFVLRNGSYLIKAGIGVAHAHGYKYIPEWYNNSYGMENATLINVSLHNETSGIDIYLSKAGSISGYVCSEEGNPIGDANVYAFSDIYSGTGANTQPDGNYIIEGLPSGNYTVQVTVSGYFSEYYDNATDSANATNVTVNAPDDISGVNFALKSETVYKGDLNRDGTLTPADAAIALQIAVGSRPFDDAADVSGDNRVTSLDALMILQAAAGAISL